MEDLNKKSHFLVILMGGKSSRIGRIGKIISKTLLPLYNSNLLFRQIEQAIEANIDNIILSVCPQFYSQVALLVNESLPQYKEKVQVVSNNTHRLGPLYALSKILDMYSTDRVIMSLGDIYFLNNPFLKSRLLINTSKTYILSSSVFNIIELKKGGILQLKKDRVHTIEKQTNSNNTKGLRWNGIAIFDHNLNKQLEIFLKKYGDTPQEDFFQHLIENGHKIYTETVADFINNNSPESLLVTSLYNASENYFDKDTELSKNLTNVAQQLRNKLLKE